MLRPVLQLAQLLPHLGPAAVSGAFAPAGPPGKTAHTESVSTEIQMAATQQRNSRCRPSGDGWLRIGLFGLAALFCLSVFPPAASAQTPRMVPELIVTEGNGGVPFMGPMSIAFDGRRNEVLVANTGGHRIDIFKRNGRQAGVFQRRVPGPGGQIIDGDPRAVAIDSAGRVLVSDNRLSYVDVLDFRGRSLGKLDPALPDSEITEGNLPGALTVAADGTILMATRGKRGRVYEFTPDLKLKASWGYSGKGPGHLSGITGLAVLPDGRRIVICAQTDVVVQVFDEAGQWLTGYGRHENGPGNFSMPSGIAVTGNSQIWISDELRQIVQVFDADGSYLGMVGSGGVGPGEFLYPSAIASDGGGLLAVAERVGNRFQLLSIR